MLAPNPRRRGNFDPEPHRRFSRTVVLAVVSAVFALCLVVGASLLASGRPAFPPETGRCSVTPIPDQVGNFYGQTQVFALRAVAREVPPLTKNLAVSRQPGGGFTIEIDGATASPDIAWLDHSGDGLANPEALITLPPPFAGGWNIDIHLDPERRSGFATFVSSTC